MTRPMVLAYVGESADAVLEAMRRAGCTCAPLDFDVATPAPNLAHVRVFHERGCPLCPEEEA